MEGINMVKLSRRHILQSAVGGWLWAAGRAVAATSEVDASGFVRIGGINQWIAIQGRNAGNPAILFLHGGPGEAQSPFLNEFISWKRDFTVANWDQRGAGKTFGRNGPSTPDMTLDRLIDDAIEVAEHVCGRLKQRKVILVGQSWGSFLGVHVIKRRPDLFHAFVGTGQVVSFVDNAADRAKWARQQATVAGDQKTLTALERAEKLPGAQRVMAELSASAKYRLSPQDRSYAKILNTFMHRGGSSAAMTDTEMSKLLHDAKGERADWLAGAEFSGSKLETVIETMDLRSLGFDMGLPFFVVQGRDDHITSYGTAKTYLEKVHAPAKAFIPIDGGHYACFTNSRHFVGILDSEVRRFAI